ncbi:AgmX/PglI C-terminal domain-containing protein [Anaeromyxobacter paludicola]|uniref:MJ0042 family finger-like protein n=1 Tax=Anaeromyxobacter paludicola TaxID=2918171 RepID=A0ABM7XA06_9BACT|nr:AgmX/PglI C-terminal domain-containing protein [Anaeromyxobacter paludicola]BDG08680.1 hypothetical protein AMPC_17930 [Anaeromyxobacter paludicola]
MRDDKLPEGKQGAARARGAGRVRAAARGTKGAMQFSCEACEARYLIPEERLGRAGVRVRCKKCGHVVRVRPPSAAELELVEGAAGERNVAVLPPAPPRAPGAGVEWFVAGEGSARGPLEVGAVRRQLAAGELPAAALVWREGLVGWTPASAIPELAGPAPAVASAVPRAPPPLPVAAPPPQLESAAAAVLAELARRDVGAPRGPTPRGTPSQGARPAGPPAAGPSPERRVLYASLALAVVGAASLGAGAAWLASRPSPERAPAAPRAAAGPGAEPGALARAPSAPPPASAGAPVAAAPPGPAAAPRPEPAPAAHGAPAPGERPVIAKRASPAAERAPAVRARSKRAEAGARAPEPRTAALPRKSAAPEVDARRAGSGKVEPAATASSATAGASAAAAPRPALPALPPPSRPPRSEDELLAELGASPKPAPKPAAAAPAPQPAPRARPPDPLLDSVSDDELTRELGSAPPPAQKRSVYVPPAAPRATASAAPAAAAPALPERLTPEQVNRAVAARTSDLKRCIADQRAAEPGLKGTLKVRLVIGGDGAVREAAPVTEELAGKPIARCIAGVVKDTRFPPSRAGGQEVIFPFKF